MVTIDLVEVSCAMCMRNPAVALKIEGDPKFPKIEIYCRKHGQAQRKIMAEHYTIEKVEFKDLT